MGNTNDLLATDLRWVRPSRKAREYELQAAEVPIVKVRWEARFGNRATVESEAGSWGIDKKGILRPRVLITETNWGTPLATFRGNWLSGGTLEFRDGRSYTWKNTNFLRTRWVWLDRQSQPLLSFRGKETTIEPAGRTLSEISLLAALSWYIYITNKESGDGGGAAVVASMGM